MQKGKKNKKNTKQMDWGVQAVSKGGAVMKKKENGLLDQIRAIRLKSDSSDQIIDSGNRGLQIIIQGGWRRGCMVAHTIRGVLFIEIYFSFLILFFAFSLLFLILSSLLSSLVPLSISFLLYIFSFFFLSKQPKNNNKTVT